MKKRLFPLALALVMALSLAVPAFAQDGPPALDVSVSGTDESAPPEDREFTLRNFTEEELIDGSRFSTLRTVFTRNEGTEAVEAKGVTTLAPGSSVTISGLRPRDDSAPWDVLQLRAWSDPDGDGVYDQRLFTYYCQGEGQRSPVVVSASAPGPFLYYRFDASEGRPVYSSSLCAGDGVLVGPGSVDFDTYFEGCSSVTLTGDRLARLFGPNTLVRLEAAVRDHGIIKPFEGDGTRLFHFYIPEGEPEPEPVPEFTDTPSWCVKEAQWAVERKITNGYGGNDKFAPDIDCTVQEILTFLWRAENRPEYTGKAPRLVAAWYADGVNWAYEKGLIGDSFVPDAPCTRAQAVTFIWKALGEPEAEAAAGFPDVDAEDSCAAAVDWALEKGVTKSYGGTGGFAPDRVCSRGEIACFLYRAYN